MNVSTINTADMSAKGMLQKASLSYPTNNIEKILLFLIAAIGLVGSTYIFAVSSGSSPTPDIGNIAAAAPITDSENEEAEWKEKFGDYIQIEGKKKVGEPITFKFVAEKDGGRYVMEMGNGNRMIITGAEWPFTYDKPGKYLLELKRIDKGLIKTVATKKIKVK